MMLPAPAPATAGIGLGNPPMGGARISPAVLTSLCALEVSLLTDCVRLLAMSVIHAGCVLGAGFSGLGGSGPLLRAVSSQLDFVGLQRLESPYLVGLEGGVVRIWSRAMLPSLDSPGLMTDSERLWFGSAGLMKSASGRS